MAPLQNSSNSSKNSSQTPQLQNSLELPTPWSCSANGGGVLEHLFCNSNSTQSCSIRQFQLHSKLAPPKVLEWSSSTQSWSHVKQGLIRRCKLSRQARFAAPELLAQVYSCLCFVKSEVILLHLYGKVNSSDGIVFINLIYICKAE